MLLSILFHLKKCGHEPLGLIKSLWNINQEIRYVFVQCLVPWCFINLISKCFKNQLTEPGALPKMPYAQRSPGQINLTKNTRRHVHSSAYLTLPWFHHPPGNSRGGTNTGTLCRFRMGRKANCRAKVKPSTMCISKFMFPIYISVESWAFLNGLYNCQ